MCICLTTYKSVTFEDKELPLKMSKVVRLMFFRAPYTMEMQFTYMLFILEPQALAAWDLRGGGVIQLEEHG